MADKLDQNPVSLEQYKTIHYIITQDVIDVTYNPQVVLKPELFRTKLNFYI